MVFAGLSVCALSYKQRIPRQLFRTRRFVAFLHWRINEGLTRNELCIASGVHHNSICRAEAGENMTLMNLMKIADGLGVRIQDLLYEDVD